MVYARLLGRAGGTGRKFARLIDILLADRSRGRERRAIAGERLRHAFVILADDGALRVELRIALISLRERRLHRFAAASMALCGDPRCPGRAAKPFFAQ